MMREAVNLLPRIVEAERDQNKGEARINDVVANAEREIAALDRRHLGPEERRTATVVIRDKAALLVRDVRRNMLKRAIAARRMQETLATISLLGVRASLKMMKQIGNYVAIFLSS
jgi:hypothetical protein